ncbi:MAG TPA: PAS domain S-box protein, partial [Rhodocyclaceae bacterium]|nr:PAS domain S-box protein [Rhodocyclaceae bacterium]
MNKLTTALLSLIALAWTSRKLMKRFPPEQAAADQGAPGHVLAIADANADGVLTLDAAGRIEAVNGVVRTLLGFDEHELRGRDLRVLLPRLAWSAASPDGVRSAEVGGAWQARCRHGEMIEVEVTLAALPGPRSNG